MRGRQAGVKFIFFTMLLDAVGVGLLVPVLPDVLRRFSSDPTQVSLLFGYFIGVYAFMQFFASPLLGSLSDRFGRRSILLISLLGAGLDYIFMGLAPNLGLLFLGRFISGLTGASMTVAGSYMADISDDSNRAANFGLMGAAWGLGFILGPALGALVLGLGPKAPFFAAAGLNLLNFAYGLWVLPESLAEGRRSPFDVKKLNPLRSIFKILRPSPYVALIWIFFLIFLSGQVHPVNWALYTELKFHWSNREVGWSLSFVGVTIAIGNALLTRWLVPKLGPTRSVTIGIFTYALAFALFAMASEGWMMYAIMLFFMPSCLAMPSLQSIVVRQIPEQEQGEFQGSLVALGSLASVLAPILFTKLFISFTGPAPQPYFPGAAYAGAAILSLLALGLDLFRPTSQDQAPSDPSFDRGSPSS